MKTIRCIACTREFDTGPAYLSHTCEKPLNVRLDEAIARADDSLEELEALLAEYEDDDEIELDTEETSALVSFVEVPLAVLAAVGILGFFVVDWIAGRVRS